MSETTTFDWPVHPAADLFPLIDGDDLAELAEDIRAHGLREPVWLWDDPERGTVLLDGRNRARACASAGVEVRTREYRGTDPIGFSISQNLKRRHLSVGQKASVAYDALSLIEAENRKRSLANLVQNQRNASAETLTEVADLPPRESMPEPPTPVAEPAEPPTKSRDKAAAIVGVSGRALGQFKRVAISAPDLADKVRSGSLPLDRAERIIRDRDATTRRQVEAAAQVAQLEVGTRVDIRHGDFREVLADLTNVDAIITDPPYPHEFIPLLGDLAAWADKVLAPDGVLAILMGQTYLPEVYRLLDGGRPYRWTGCYLTPGAGYASMARKVQSNWKPLLVYGGGPSFGDTLRSEASDADAKDRHKWGQDYGAFHEIVRRLTKPGQTVVDPFMGSGTTLLAAKAQGRHAIGCDVEAEHVEHARGWLA